MQMTSSKLGALEVFPVDDNFRKAKQQSRQVLPPIRIDLQGNADFMFRKICIFEFGIFKFLNSLFLLIKMSLNTIDYGLLSLLINGL